MSIVILNWNGERVIRLCLDSIKKLDYPDKEVIVVDNGSEDMSVDIIREECREFRLIENLKNLGFSAGMNVGIKESRGSLILLCNNDAILHPTSLSLMVNTILSSTKIGIVGGLILYHEPNDVIGSLGGKFDPVTGMIWADGHGLKLSAKSELEKGLITDLDYVSGCVFLVRREVIQRIGLLDEESFIGGEDIDWCLKARRVGFECILNPSARIWHNGSFASRQNPLRSYTQRLASDFRVIMLHFPIVPMLSTFFFQLAIAPFLEVLFFKQSEISAGSKLQARINVFCANLSKISKLSFKRKKIAALGVVHLKIRAFELLKFILFRIRLKEFYLGRLLEEVK